MRLDRDLLAAMGLHRTKRGGEPGDSNNQPYAVGFHLTSENGLTPSGLEVEAVARHLVDHDANPQAPAPGATD